MNDLNGPAPDEKAYNEEPNTSTIRFDLAQISPTNRRRVFEKFILAALVVSLG